MILQRYPIFRIFLFFCSGIILARYFPIPHKLAYASSMGLLLLSVISSFTPALFHSRRRRIFFGILLSLFFLNLGVLLSQWHSQLHFQLHLSPESLRPHAYRLILLEKPREKTNSFSALASIEQYDSSLNNYRTAKAMVYFQKSSAISQINYGSVLITGIRPHSLKAPQNPYEFDYKNHLALKSVYYRLFLDSGSYYLSDLRDSNPLLATAKDWREKLMTNIDNWQLPANEAAISKALLLGYRYEIDDDQLEAYAAAGAMHVLAVSGLHVGILYLLAYNALFFLSKVPYGNTLRSILLIVLLWVFALLTGLSASVVRAATMFSFVAFGSSFRRYTSVYNTILASAMLLLVIKPAYLFELGFQLSYAAVLGIVWLQPRFQALWSPSNWLLRQLWAISTVSLAAQLATFPLSLYYFHQFPSLFLLANLLVIPIVTVVMYLGLINLLLSAFGLSITLILQIYQGLLQIMNKGIGWFENQDNFLIEQIHLNQVEMALCYIFILCFFAWALYGGYRKICFATVSLLLLSISQYLEARKLANEPELVVYQINRHTAIGIYLPGESYFICDSLLAADSKKLSFHVEQHWWAREAGYPQLLFVEDSWQSRQLYYRQNQLGVGGSSYSLIDKTPLLSPPGQHWIITGKALPPDYCNNLPQQVIVGGAVSRLYQNKWRQWAKDNTVAYYNTHEMGAWTRRGRLHPY